MILAKLKETIKHSCKEIYGLCPEVVQNAIISGYSYLQCAQKYGRLYRENLDFLMRSQWLPPEELQDIQAGRLRNLLSHAYATVPYYRAVFDRLRVCPEEIKTTEDLKRLPFLTKSDIVHNFDQLISNQYYRVQGHLIGTSGTTGMPIQFYWDRRCEAMEAALIQRYRSWAGFIPGDRMVVLTGLAISTRSAERRRYWRINYSGKQLFLSSSHMSKSSLPDYLEQVRKFQPLVIWGYPSSVYVLARFLDDHGQRLGIPLKGIFLSSEPLYDWQRSVIERALEARVFDRYGLSEAVISANECEQHNGYHVNVEAGVLEVIPSPDVPGVNEIVATGLDNYMMPLIRYRTGDVVDSFGGACSCGRGLPLMGKVETKIQDSILTPDGRSISPSVLTFPFKSLKGVVKSQLVQTNTDRLVIKLVVDDRYDMSTEPRLIAAMVQRLGGNITVSVEYVPDIPHTAAGKYRWVVSDISQLKANSEPMM